jgi:DNA-binding response OmpR family regulator
MARILVVDDDARITELLADFLAELGHEVEIANDGASAFKAFEKRRPDLLVTDYHMPGGSGAQLVSKIRAAAQGAPIGAIVMSGSAAADDPLDLAKLPRMRYLEKPVNYDRLKEAVEALLTL